jgi:hypothetical protein
MKPISPSSDNSQAPDSVATDSLWQPFWWRWFYGSALSQFWLKPFISSLGALTNLALSTL